MGDRHSHHDALTIVGKTREARYQVIGAFGGVRRLEGAEECAASIFSGLDLTRALVSFSPETRLLRSSLLSLSFFPPISAVGGYFPEKGVPLFVTTVRLAAV